MGGTQLGLHSPSIQTARVVDVNVSTWTVSVATLVAKKPLTDIPFSVPYAHHYNGEGVYFMPEVGSVCWVCTPSDGNMPFVLGWFAPNYDGDFSAGKQQLNPGDIYLGTRDENFMVLRRGGVVQIGATPLAQRLFLPLNNTIRDLCERYNLQTLGGDLEWTVTRPEDSTDGNRPAYLKIRAKQFADDEAYVAELQIGSHESQDTAILDLIVRASGQKGADTKFSLTIEKDGKVSWKVEDNVKWEVKGTYGIKAEKDINIESKKKVSIAAMEDFEASGANAKMFSTTGPATVKAPSQVILEAPTVHAGGPSAMQPVAMATPLMTWLASHFHLVILPVPGTPTSPPAVPPVPVIVSTTLFATK